MQTVFSIITALVSHFGDHSKVSLYYLKVLISYLAVKFWKIVDTLPRLVEVCSGTEDR